jgi:uncharacterized damage-inducible protein DinB
MKEILSAQYAMVKSSRGVLLDYCDKASPEHFTQSNPGFGRGGSMRNLLVHIADVYHHWMGGHALGQRIVFPDYESIHTVSECRNYFNTVDVLVAEFMDHFERDYLTPLSLNMNNGTVLIGPLEIFTHVITHEFHHKGQVLSISRHWGYEPVDTDVIRTG